MLGSMTWHGEVYALGEDGQWAGPNAAIVEMLEPFTPRYYPAGGVSLPVGFEAVAAAAKAFGDPNPTLPAFAASAPGVIH